MRDYSGLLEGLSAGIADLTTSEKWTQYLDVQSKFYRYSPNNVMLILLQNPYATRVAGYNAWKALDHQAMAKESALRILAETAGEVRVVENDGIVRATESLARRGLWAEPTSGAAWASISDEPTKASGPVVVSLGGAGFKSLALTA